MMHLGVEMDSGVQTLSFTVSDNIDKVRKEFMSRHGLKPAFDKGLKRKMEQLLISGKETDAIDIVDLLDDF